MPTPIQLNLASTLSTTSRLDLEYSGYAKKGKHDNKSGMEGLQVIGGIQYIYVTASITKMLTIYFKPLLQLILPTGCANMTVFSIHITPS